jgi:hypothetical protein
MKKDKIKHLFRTFTKMTVLLIVLLIIIGCKPKQIIQEKVVTKIDSSQVVTLKDELQKKTIEVELLKTDLERTRDENIRLQSEVSSHVINYDTGAQIKPDGQYPKANETITQSKVIYENTIKQLEFLSQSYGKKVDSLITLNRNLQQSIELVTNENKSLSEKTTPTTGFNFRLFLIGIVVGILLCFILWLLSKRYEEKRECSRF